MEPKTEPEMKGWLFKWTNYLKGYQKRWFVLTNGLLSYYKNQAEMAHTCRGTISLFGALIHTEDACAFVVSNGGTQTFHLKAANEVERQRWVTALELAKAKAIRTIESEEEEDDFDTSVCSQKNELQSMLKSLSTKLEDLQTCSELIAKHGAALQRALSEMETFESDAEMSTHIKSVNERATLFRITANAMLNTCSEYLNLALSHGSKWQRLLQHERDQKIRLENMVEQLARQHSHLEKAAKEHQIPTRDISNVTSSKQQGTDQSNSPSVSDGVGVARLNIAVVRSSPSDEEDDVEFYDAQDDVTRQETKSNFVLKIPMGHHRTASDISMDSHMMDGSDETSGSGSDVDDTETKVVVISSSSPGKAVEWKAKEENTGNHEEERHCTSTRVRRTRIPDKPNYPLSLWSIMKNCIGKDLSKIPIPVNFSEPLSMLQRLAEDYEYANILDKAAQLKDTCEQLAYVAAFTVSSYSTTSNRTGKPFNPLLGETYEFDRMEDLGWKVVAEQVSHHPPMVAQHCEGRGWRCWQEFTMASKFRGKYLQVIPLGMAHLEFQSGCHYTWRKVTTTVHNIIVGKLWVDQHGDMDIVNHTTGAKCHLKYIPYSYFSRDVQRKVTGFVYDRDGNAKFVLSGTWDNKMDVAPVVESSGSPKNPVVKTGAYVTVWQRKMPPEDSEKYYNFTELACQLNELDEGVAPTDSRNRPDQRLMENGLWDEANAEKLRLEEKQRSARREREASAERAAATGQPYPPYEPVWFKKERDTWTGNIFHMYQGRYWDCKSRQDWSMCPDIF
ncbi:hypothetical protein PR048_025890 [Dryococelus australis]|uniref:PH domain-containing protein n=1 Tax=Dryococelus australis TaxID=614101 RepID=A0ABQ9GJV7_9NEOP|nr:hypothetical protein PR048_025890 [Dryococelus australis]